MKESLYYLFLSGIILGSGPCIGFCAPLLAGAAAAYRSSFGQGVVLYLNFCAGKILSYIILGLICGFFAGLKNQHLGNFLAAVNIASGIFILSMGVLTMAVKDAAGSRYCRFFAGSSVKNGMLLGFLAGFSPCLPLLGILDYILIISRGPFDAAFYLFVFGLATAVSPVILLSGFSGKLGGRLLGHPKAARWLRVGAGLVLAVMGAGILIKYF